MNKKHELYKATLPAFFKNEFCSDILIFIWSMIGAFFAFFFITLINDLEGISEVMLVTAIVAFFAYFITSIMILLVFYFNKKQLLNIIENAGNADELAALTLLDKIKYWPFGCGIVANGIFALDFIDKQLAVFYR